MRCCEALRSLCSLWHCIHVKSQPDALKEAPKYGVRSSAWAGAVRGFAIEERA